MAYIQERQDKEGKFRYRVQIRVQGHPTQSKTFERKTDAKLWAQQTETSIREGRYFKLAESKKHTIGEMIDRYIRDELPSKPKNAKNTYAQLIWWKEQIGYCTLSDVTSGLIIEKRDLLARGITSRGKKRSNATVVRYLAALSHAFSTAIQWGWIEDSPTRKVSKPREERGRVRFLDDEERYRLLEACKASSNPYIYIVVVLALSTGMRASEIKNLVWRDVELERGRIVLQHTKNGERRVLPITGVALELLKELASTPKGKDDLLFPGQTNLKPMNLRFPWEQVLKSANIENFRFHDLRHCCASYLAMSGASLAEIAEVLGHKTLSMVKRYAHLSEAHTTSVVANMNKKYIG